MTAKLRRKAELKKANQPWDELRLEEKISDDTVLQILTDLSEDLKSKVCKGMCVNGCAFGGYLYADVWNSVSIHLLMIHNVSGIVLSP